LSCTAGLPSCTEHLTQDVPIDIPDGLLNGAPLAIILGATAWVAACLRSHPVQNGNGHDDRWHKEFRGISNSWFAIFDDPHDKLPELSVKGFEFLEELYSDGVPWFNVDKEEESMCTLKTFVTVAIFLRNKNVLLHCCRRCQVLFARFFLDTALSASLGDLSLDSDESGGCLQFTSDIEDLVTTEDIDQELDESDGVPDSLDHTTTERGDPRISEDLVVGMEAFTDIMINKNLTKEELQSQLATKFNLLVCTCR